MMTWVNMLRFKTFQKYYYYSVKLHLIFRKSEALLEGAKRNKNKEYLSWKNK